MKTLPAPHLLAALLLLLVGLAGLEVAAAVQDHALDNRALSLSDAAIAVLAAMWVDSDSRGRESIYRPFEFGWLILVFSLLYLPYYVWRTRGWRGVVALVGGLTLYGSGVLTQIAYLLAT